MRRGDRGAGTLLVAMLLALLVGLAVVVAGAAQVRATVVRLQGAADLASLAGAEAQRTRRVACPAARASATANGVEVVECLVEGDEVEFVVRVSVVAPVGVWPVGQIGQVRAHANAGVVVAGEGGGP